MNTMVQAAARDPVVIDVGTLPTFAFGHRSLVWWATVGLIAIESTVFALAVMAYFYIWTRVDRFPPSAAPPALSWGVVNLAIMLVSLVPNQLAKRAAERLDLRGVRVGIAICVAMAFAFLIVRIFEFRALNISWDSNAYGSAVWMLMGLHTTHLLTDTWDTATLAYVLWTRPQPEGKRFVDVSENAFYWYFVVGSWLPLYAVIYFAPRLLAK
jgi:cytochrome c oxidase subunit III